MFWEKMKQIESFVYWFLTWPMEVGDMLQEKGLEFFGKSMVLVWIGWLMTLACVVFGPLVLFLIMLAGIILGGV